MLRFDHAYPLFIKSLRAAGALATLGAALSGCGFRYAEPREAWRGQAEAACMKSGLVREGSFIRQMKPIDGPGPCGADLPLKVSAFEVKRETLSAALASVSNTDFQLGGISNHTSVKPDATLGCPMVAWTEDWIAGAVQPAAIAWFGQGVREMRAGSYACRRRNHNPNARLSEHSYGNALDIMAFVLNDGAVVTVKGGWRGSPQEQGFLRDVFFEACQRFRTVLGPGSDALHYDHFHLDLAHHDAQGRRRYCKPVVAAPQRPLPGTYLPGGQVPPGGPPLNAFAAPGNNATMMASAPPAWRAPPAVSARPPMPGSATQPYPAQQQPYPAQPYPAQQPYPAPGAQAPRPAGAGTLDGAAINETEPDFDPRDFDIATGSITPLPEPKPVPRASRKPARARVVSAPQRGGYDPAGRN